MHNQTWRRRSTRRMVVGDQHRDPILHQRAQFGVVGDAAVYCDEQVAGLEVLRHPIHQHPVALLQAVRDKGVNLGPQFPQAIQQQGRAGQAVGVVVAVNPYALAFFQSFNDAQSRPLEAIDGKAYQGGLEVFLAPEPRFQKTAAASGGIPSCSINGRSSATWGHVRSVHFIQISYHRTPDQPRAPSG